MNLSPTDKSRLSVSLPVIIIFGFAIILGGYLMGVWLMPFLFPPEASAEAKQIDDLFQITLMIGGAVFLLVQGLLLYSVVRFRVPESDMSDGPSIHGNTTLELIWTAIPSLIVLVLVVLSYQVWVDIRAVKPGENLVNGQPVPVMATGQRFAWAFSYNTPVINPADNTPVVVRSDILNTYVGQKVRLQLQSLDVIHSFWIPVMRIKQDLMPGRTTDVTFTVVAPENVAFNEAGYMDFPVVCAELCGSGHGQMRATVRVWQTEQQYIASFYTPSVDAVLHPPADPVLRGATILASGAYPCANCHTLNFQGPNGIVFDWQGNQAPSLNGIADRAVLRVPSLTAEEYLKQSLDDPHAFLVPGYGPLMPDFQSEDSAAPNFMTDIDRAAIVGFLCTVSDTGDTACTIDPAEIGASAEATAEATDSVTAEVTSEATEAATPVSETTETAVLESEATAEATEAP